MRSKNNLCILLALLITVSAFSIVAYAGSSEKVTASTLGNHYTDSVTCTTLVVMNLTTYSGNVSGHLQCYVDSAWNDVSGSTLSKSGNTSIQYTPDDLDIIFDKSKSSYSCRGRLNITVPVTLLDGYCKLIREESKHEE